MKFSDLFKKKSAPKKEEFATKSRMGLDVEDTLIELLDVALTKAGESPEVLESLTADAHVMSVIQTRKLGTLKKKFYISSGDDQKASKTLADDLNKDLKKIDLYNLIAQILNAPFFGMTPIEIIWTEENGRYKITDLRALPPSWFGFNADNNPRLKNENNENGLVLPAGKFVFAKHFPTYKNPFGLALLSRCYWPVAFKKGGIKFWIKLLEKFGLPFLIGKYPQGTPEAEQTELLNSLNNAAQSFVMVAPEGGSVEVLETNASTKAQAHESLKSAMDAEISKVILGQNLTTEVKGGSYAASKTHGEVLATYYAADQALVTQTMAEIFNLYKFVNNDQAEAPLFNWAEEPKDKTTLAKRDLDLKAQGVNFTKTYYITNYGLKEDEFMVQSDQNQKMDLKGVKPPNFNEFKEGESFDFKDSRKTNQNEIDDLADELLKNDAEKLLHISLEDLFKSVESEPQLLKKLEDLLKEEPKTEHLETALFIASEIGAKKAKQQTQAKRKIK